MEGGLPPPPCAPEAPPEVQVKAGLQGREGAGFTVCSLVCVCVCVCVCVACRESPGGSGEAGSGSQRFPVCLAPGAWPRVLVPAQHVQGQGAGANAGSRSGCESVCRARAPL